MTEFMPNSILEKEIQAHERIINNDINDDYHNNEKMKHEVGSNLNRCQRTWNNPQELGKKIERNEYLLKDRDHPNFSIF